MVYACLPPWQAREEVGLGQPTWPEPVLKVPGREQLHQPLREAPRRCGPASQPNMPRLDPSVPSSVREIAEGLSWLRPRTPSAAEGRTLVGREPWLQHTDGRPSTQREPVAPGPSGGRCSLAPAKTEPRALKDCITERVVLLTAGVGVAGAALHPAGDKSLSEEGGLGVRF